MQHTVSVLVENHFGVLARVAGLFSARGFNIDSLAVGETQDPEVSRMTVIANGDDRVVEQIMKQLNKLVDVICVEDLTTKDMIARELVLIKIRANATNRNDIMHVVNTFRAKIVDVGPESLTIEVTGSEGKIDAPIGRDPRDRKKMTVHALGRTAQTSYRVIDHLTTANGKYYTLLEARLHTGRTHQIRVHFASIGHPIYGDTVYGHEDTLLPRQFLHATRLTFTLPGGTERSFEAPLTSDLLECLHTLTVE